MNAHDRAKLREALDAYDALVRPALALTTGQARKREELRAVLCQMTGHTNLGKALKCARRMIFINPATKKRKKSRYTGLHDIVPHSATPRMPDAARVTGIVPTAIETNRRAH